MILLGLGACSTAEKETMSEQTQTENQEASKKDAAENKEASKSEKTEASEGSKTSCTLDKDTRVIEVKKTEAGGCELFYTKFGEAKSVASSGFGTQYCEEVKDRIESNLKKAGFTCQ